MLCIYISCKSIAMANLSIFIDINEAECKRMSLRKLKRPRPEDGGAER